MMGGLYGDLPPPSASKAEELKAEVAQSLSAAKAAAAAWAASKLAPTALRKPSPFAPPPSVLRAQNKAKESPLPPRATTSVLPPGTSAASGSGYSDSGAAVATGLAALNDYRPSSPPASHPNLAGSGSAVADEYDPARPNDYEEFCRERRLVKRAEDLRREMERQRQQEEERERERERELLRQRDLERAREEERERDATPSRAAGLSVSGEEAWKRRGMLTAGRGGPVSTPEGLNQLRRSPSPPRSAEGGGFSLGKGGGGLGIGAGGQMTAAERMMAKMGWKAGQGLGKDQQGITTPLMVRKTDKRAGAIVNASPLETAAQQQQQPQVAAGPGGKPKGSGLGMGTPTRVVLLRNMVGPGEVDDELEDEVAGECQKYGEVTRVLIFEITEEGFPATESVRIFAQFDRPESATKAVVDLNGRFFGGRTVRASFYDEDRFARNELAPVPGEVPAE